MTRLGKLTAQIREEIIGRCAPGDMLPSERYLASTYRAGRVTVHKALGRLCREGWLTRGPGHGYVVARPGRKLLQTTGLFFATNPFVLLVLPFFRDVYFGITQTAAMNKRHILSIYGSAWRAPELNWEDFWSPRMRAVDSLLILEVPHEELFRRAAELCPVVSVDMPCRLETVSTVCFDHTASIHLAFKYLLDQGHRRIGYAGKKGPQDPADVERLAAFARALRWTDERPADDPVFGMSGAKADTVVTRWLQLPAARRPTALIVTHAFWDLVARLHVAGVRIPEQLSLVHVGTLTTWSDHAKMMMIRYTRKECLALAPLVEPPFHNKPGELAAMVPTTVHLSGVEMGRLSVLELIRRKADPSLAPSHHLLAPELIPGSTVRRLG